LGTQQVFEVIFHEVKVRVESRVFETGINAAHLGEHEEVGPKQHPLEPVVTKRELEHGASFRKRRGIQTQIVNPLRAERRMCYRNSYLHTGRSEEQHFALTPGNHLRLGRARGEMSAERLKLPKGKRRIGPKWIDQKIHSG
jgi:hypothetical protein